MIDIYETWIRDFGIDGFRIDTMKHVNDEFWQRFAPEVLDLRPPAGQARVLHVRRGVRHHQVVHVALHRPTTACRRCSTSRSSRPRQNFAANSRPTDELRDFFVGDDWYTDADSNAYQLPTFLGNHDMGRIGRFVKVANGGAGRRRAAGPRPAGARS